MASIAIARHGGEPREIIRRALWVGGTFLVLPALLAWFALVAMDGSSHLIQQDVRLPQSTAYDPYFDDFVVFYSAGLMARQDGADGVYRLEAIHRTEERVAQTGNEDVQVLPFFNAPHTLLGLAVLSVLPLGIAAAVWTVAGLATFVVALGCVARGRLARLDWSARALWAGGLGSSVPVFQTVLHGQMAFFLFGGWAMVWLGAFQARRPWVAAGGLVILAMKPPLLLLPVVSLLLTRQWAAVGRAAVIVVAGTAVVLSFGGAQMIRDYLSLLAHAASWEDANGISTWGMFGWNAFVRSVLGEAGAELRMAATVVLSGATLSLAWLALRRDGVITTERRFAVVVFGTLLISPHVYAHDLIFAALPLFLLATMDDSKAARGWALFALAGWFLLYFHFDLLQRSRVNLTTIAMAGALCAAAWGGRATLPAVPEFRRPRTPSRLRSKEADTT